MADKLRFKFVKDNAGEKREADYYEKLILGQAAKEMKALGLYDFFYGKWKRVIDGYIRKEHRSQWLSALLSLTGDLISSAATAASIVFAIVLMVRGALLAGRFGCGHEPDPHARRRYGQPDERHGFLPFQKERGSHVL